MYFTNSVKETVRSPTQTVFLEILNFFSLFLKLNKINLNNYYIGLSLYRLLCLLLASISSEGAERKEIDQRRSSAICRYWLNCSLDLRVEMMVMRVRVLISKPVSVPINLYAGWWALWNKASFLIGKNRVGLSAGWGCPQKGRTSEHCSDLREGRTGTRADRKAPSEWSLGLQSCCPGFCYL